MFEIESGTLLIGCATNVLLGRVSFELNRGYLPDGDRSRGPCQDRGSGSVIDGLIWELHSLTDDEIRMIEGTTR